MKGFVVRQAQQGSHASEKLGIRLQLAQRRLSSRSTSRPTSRSTSRSTHAHTHLAILPAAMEGRLSPFMIPNTRTKLQPSELQAFSTSTSSTSSTSTSSASTSSASTTTPNQDVQPLEESDSMITVHEATTSVTKENEKGNGNGKKLPNHKSSKSRNNKNHSSSPSSRLAELRNKLAAEERNLEKDLEMFAKGENAFTTNIAAEEEEEEDEEEREEEAREEEKGQSMRADQLQNSGKEGKKASGGLKGKKKLKKPPWLKISATQGENLENYKRLKETVKDLGLATVCEEAKCPNIGECWGGGKDQTATATIMIMGDTCTRACRFCAVKTSLKPPPLDPNEPAHVSEAIARWGLDYVVLTSVDRDDLEDHGSAHFAETVELLKQKSPSSSLNPDGSHHGLLVECLTPDFGGHEQHVQRVAKSGLDVFAHNLETVQELQSTVRDRRANYAQSLRVLETARNAVPNLVTKTSVMLGLGETHDQVRQLMRDCLDSGVQVITFGQYLRPTKGHIPIHEYVTPEVFDMFRQEGEEMGFRYVASGPLVRSSYKAGEFFLRTMLQEGQAQGQRTHEQQQKQEEKQQQQQQTLQ